MVQIGKKFIEVACMVCGHPAPPSLTQLTCEACGSPWLEARYDYEAVAGLWPDILKERTHSLWRYHDLLPVPPEFQVSFGEGWTPLVRANRLEAELGHEQIYIKDERLSPTSSFKDRQATVAVSALKTLGIKELVMASTGNASAAYSAYCARAGIKLWVFVNSLVPAEKIREAALYGTEVIKITGTYDQAKVVAAEFAKRHGIPVERGAKAIVGKESMKTIAFEIAEQLGWRAPDWYIQAVSGGIGPVGVWKGFTELKRMGLIDRLPKLGIVQVEGCSPMVQAFQAGKEQAEPVTPHTAITVLATGDPGHAYTLLHQAASEHGGAMVAVSDEEAFRSMRHIARTEGYSVEPATSVAFAGLRKLIDQGVIQPNETVVVNASGHTLPVEKFILGDQYVVNIELSSPLSTQWGLPEEGIGAALEHLDEKVTTIALIDDSPQDSRLIRRLLSRHKSYRVFEAHDGQSGVELVREYQPDLVILDLMMPEMNGFDVLAALKTDPATRSTPVIVVTAKTLNGEERRKLEDQALSIWLKGSYQTAELIEHIIQELGDEPLPQQAAEQRSPARKRRSQAKESADTYTHTILVIDDNPLDGRLVQRALEQQGKYRILQALTGEQAMTMIRQDRPDLILLDLMLPDTTGFELVKQIRRHKPTSSTPVIVLTAKDLTPSDRARLEQDVDSALFKGNIKRTSLQETIEQVIERSS